MPSISYIGAVIAVEVGLPATLDQAGYENVAMVYDTIGKIASWGAAGDQSEDITVSLLEGRVEHVNGALDGGSQPFTLRYDDADTGQNVLRANANTNQELSFKITDPDGEVLYFSGKCANLRDIERTPSNYKGMEGEIRVNTGVVRVAAP